MRSPRYFAWLILVVMAVGLYGERLVVERPDLVAQALRNVQWLGRAVTEPCR